MKSLQRVLNKMPKGTAQRANLKSAQPKKVMLNKVSEIEDKALMYGGGAVEALDAFYEGREKIIYARDILRFDINMLSDVRDEYQNMVSELEDIVGEVPANVAEIAESVQNSIDAYNELVKELESFGIDPMASMIDDIK